MPSEEVPARAIIFIVLVFLVLVLVQVRWGFREGDRTEPDEQGPRLSHIQIAEDDQVVDLAPESLLTRRELAELMEGRIRSLAGRKTNERRVAAIQLAYMTNDPREHEKLLRLGEELLERAEDALLKGLQDTDEAVAKSCREALVGLWRISDSTAAGEHFRQGLAAVEARQWDLALQTFESIEGLAGSVPPDLYRMKAEVYLAKSLPEQALAECLHALQAEPRHFMAFYVLARAYAQNAEYDDANRALNKALSIYTDFPEALRLRARILALQEETGP